VGDLVSVEGGVDCHLVAAKGVEEKAVAGIAPPVLSVAANIATLVGIIV
jgi:hypothetical protein